MSPKRPERYQIAPLSWRPMTDVERNSRCAARKRGERVAPWPREQYKKDDPNYERDRLREWREWNPEKRKAQSQRHNASRLPNPAAAERANDARRKRRILRRTQRQCQRCGGWADPDHFKLNSHRTLGSYRSNTCLACHADMRRGASQEDIEKAKPVRCRCGNRESWVDAIDLYTGSTWHLCRCCGAIHPTRRTWQRPDGLMFLDWERVVA